MNDLTNKFWKKIAALIGIGMVFFAAIYFAKKYKASQKIVEITKFYDQFSNETYIEFAKKLEKAIHTENPQVFDNSVDLASLFGFSSHELSTNFNKRKAIEVLEPYLKIGNTISAQLIDQNDFKYTKFYKKDGVPHVVFRLYQSDLINFMDFTLGIKKDTIIITNIYNFYSGILFSEMASELYYESVNRTQSFISDMKINQQVRNNVEIENYEEAYNVLIAIPENKRNVFHHHLLLIVAGHYDIEKFIAMMNYIKNLHPEDQRLHAYYNFLENILSDDSDVAALNTTIDNLKKYVGEDPIFDLYRGILFNFRSDFDQAELFFDLVIKEDPDLYDGYYYKLHSILSQDKTKEALSLITKMHERFSIREEDLTFDLQEYKAFTNLKAYKNIFENAE